MDRLACRCAIHRLDCKSRDSYELHRTSVFQKRLAQLHLGNSQIVFEDQDHQRLR